VINRAAILLKYKAPAIQWAGEADPYDKDPGMAIDSVNEERIAYLISDADGDTEESVDYWIK